MNDHDDRQFSLRARSDFTRARFKAFLNDVWAVMAGHPNRLLSFDEIKEKLHVGGPIYKGIKTVRIEQIVGSLNRYHEFDRAFLPVQDKTADRWQRVDLAFYKDISLPPVLLYKIGQVYFVVDGHHRVSVAREQGQEFIEAEIRECATRVNVTIEDLRHEDIEILSEKVDFMERTSLDRLLPGVDIRITIPGGFDRILEHIAVHHFFMGIDNNRPVSEEESVTHWYEQVYLPIIKVVRESGILDEFPQKTEADLYLWVLDHQHYLAEEEGQPLKPPEQAARDYINHKENTDQESDK